jgi:hypothetical protein
MDAAVMYSNIDLVHCPITLCGYLTNNQVSHKLGFSHHWHAILHTIEILFKYIITSNLEISLSNRWKASLWGLADPSPPLAAIYYGIWEEACLLQDFTTNLFNYARFIDDGIGLWDTLEGPYPDCAWNQFKTAVNAWGSLTWIISPLTLQVDFLDVTFSIHNGEMGKYSIYAKELNLYLYLLPYRLLKRMVYGMFFFLSINWSIKCMIRTVTSNCSLTNLSQEVTHHLLLVLFSWMHETTSRTATSLQPTINQKKQ